MDKHKMYAHVYFNIPGNALGIAVYSLAKIPGFTGKLDPELQELTGSEKAYDLFLNTLGKGRLSPEELQQGRIFQYNQLEEQVKTLNLLGKLIAEDKEAQVAVDLDDLDFWFETAMRDLSSEKQQALKQKLSQEQKDKLAEQLRSDAFKSFKNLKTAEELQEAMKEMYISISRNLHPKTGPKDFKEKGKYARPAPPTFLTSQEFNILYYPGFRGAHHMRQTPESSTMIYPKGVASDKKWHEILISDTTQYVGAPLSSIKIQKLDYISEVLAKTFFFGLTSTEDKANFDKAIGPVTTRAEELLSDLREVEKTIDKVGGSAEAWIDLLDGQIYDSEQQVLEVIAKRNQQPEEIEQPMQLAAQVVEKFQHNPRAYQILKRLVK